MTSLCAKLQDRMAEDGAPVVREDPQAMDHVATCDDCSAVMQELEGLDALLNELPAVDAPDAVVERLMQRPELQRPPRAGFLARVEQQFQSWVAWSPWSPGTVWQPLGAAAALLLVTTVSWQLFTGGGMPLDQRPAVELFQTATVQGAAQSAPENEPVPMEEEVQDVLASAMVDTESDLQAAAPGFSLDEARSKTSLRAMGYIGDGSSQPADEATRSNASSTAPNPPKPQSEPSSMWRQDADPADLGEVYEEITVVGEVMPPPVTTSAVKLTRKPDLSKDNAAMDLVFGVPDAAPGVTAETVAPDLEGQDTLRGARKGLAKAETLGDTTDGLSDDEAYRGLEMADSLAPQEPGAPARRAENVTEGTELPSDPHAARRFLESRSRTEGVPFQPATGYWRNTYVPGDSELRHLAARLGNAAQGGDDVQAPHLLARAPRQPFDAPDNAALAVFLSSDRQAVDGRQRMLLQVGLQGTERQAGRRGAMRLTVVLDLTDEAIEDDAIQGMGALLAALAKAQEPGDQFRLVIAGHGGGEIVDADAFRHGPLTLALQAGIESARDTSLPWFSLGEAHRQAVLTASGAMDPEAPLGSSLVLLVLPDWVRSPERHEHIAHRGALEGVHTSVVSVGPHLDLEPLDRIVLAGQGHRRLLRHPSDAASIVDRELQAVSRVIARAVRLRIRLSPGVHLVDVLGSERLDTAAAQRVRDAETQVDRQLSRQLGIAADRGEDEEGLQIVIPSFYAGDSHVVLLDVVTDGAGPIADVQVRYKDLVHLENGVARSRLDLPRGRPRAPGALQRNVLENLMALELRDALMAAADHVALGEKPQAADRLKGFEALLRGLGEHVPGWLTDGDVERDLHLLSQTRRLLAAASAEPQGGPQDFLLRDSLRYSGYLKTLPPPEEDGVQADSEPPSP